MNRLFDTNILVTALIYGVLLRIAVFAGLFGILLLILLLLSLSRYAYTVLSDVAHDRRLRPPRVETAYWFDEFGPVLHSLLFFLAAVFLTSTPLLEGVLDLLRWPLFAALLIVFPASAAQVAVSKDLGAAVNPAALVYVIRTMGPRYAGLLVTCVMLGALIALSTTLLEQMGFVFGLLTDGLAVWFYLALFCLIGAAIGECRTEFGLRGEPEIRQQELQREREKGRQWYLDRAYTSLRSGGMEQGFRAIRSLIEQENNSLEIFEWLFEQMIGWDDPKHAMVVAERWIERLNEEGRQWQALELMRRCRSLSPGFVPSAESLPGLIAFAREAGWHNVVEELENLSRTGDQSR